MDATAVAIVGPTATGKSALALRLAQEYGGEIVNADALQAYRGLDVGTAKPSLEDREAVPHHLFDILEPSERYSAGEFSRRGREVLADIRRRAKMAIVVGGSGLYLRALFSGFSPMPEVPKELRAWLRAATSRRGLKPFRHMLQLHDPVLLTRLESGDTQRVLRGLEVVLASGRPLSWWQQQPPQGASMEALRIGLTLPRAILYHRIADRVSRMLEMGWVEEVEKLLAAGWAPDAPAFQAIGYRELVRYVRGNTSREAAIEAIIHATCQFAKRQETWFRKEPDIMWLRADALDVEMSRIHRILETKR